MIRVDDRTPEELETHTVVIGGTDSFMSGWGKAAGGKSYAFWACLPGDAATVEHWVRARGDIKYVRRFGPASGLNAAHVHIYVVRDGHPALG